MNFLMNNLIPLPVTSYRRKETVSSIPFDHPNNMISNKKENNKENTSYLREILPDYQRRKRIGIDNVRAVPEKIIANLNANDTSKRTRLRKYFEEFASNSSIHGFKHLAARHRHPLERFLAGVFILGGFACFLYVSIVSWYRYQNDGFIILFNQQQELMRLVKPSFIICPINAINETKFPATFKRYGIEDTPKAREFFHFISNSKYMDIVNAPDYQPAPPELWLRILNDLKIEFHYETSLPGKGVWIAVEGKLCFSIGNYVIPYGSIEYILANNWTVSPLPTYPPDIPNYQVENKELNDPNYLSSYIYNPTQNITEFLKLDIDAWVEVFDPMEIYKLKAPFTRHLLRVHEQLHCTVKVKRLLIAQGMENVPKHRRKCGIPTDKGLALWPIYSFEMCTLEYRSNIRRKECGCYTHFFRRMPGVPVCNITQIRCIVKVGEMITRSPVIPQPYEACPCNCNYIKYLSTVEKLGSTASKNDTIFEMNMIFPSYRFLKKEQFSFIDFMTVIGSAAGLFLGCSVLSAVEIFYYATLHFYITKHKYKQN